MTLSFEIEFTVIEGIDPDAVGFPGIDSPQRLCDLFVGLPDPGGPAKSVTGPVQRSGAYPRHTVCHTEKPLDELGDHSIPQWILRFRRACHNCSADAAKRFADYSSGSYPATGVDLH
ncbi:hypothetical protein [Nocardia testacea]|uniref:hypothetical protein n=1 Tax=Nocardia testacea TaxID=248551 RepID=UPI00340ECA45